MELIILQGCSSPVSRNVCCVLGITSQFKRTEGGPRIQAELMKNRGCSTPISEIVSCVLRIRHQLNRTERGPRIPAKMLKFQDHVLRRPEFFKHLLMKQYQFRGYEFHTGPTWVLRHITRYRPEILRPQSKKSRTPTMQKRMKFTYRASQEDHLKSASFCYEKRQGKFIC